MTKQDTIGQVQSPHIEAGQVKSTGGKQSQKQATKVRDIPLPLLEVP